MSGLLNGLLCVLPLSGCLPTIDLGYNLQQPTNYNSQYGVYVFYDVRYAAPSTGNNRFRAPQSPATNRSSVQTGGSQWICPQAAPNWQPITSEIFPEYEAGQTKFNQSDYPPGTPVTTPTSRTSEDCLFLDVYASKSVLDRAVAGANPSAPVIVQFYGGGYVSGAKDLNPGGWFIRDSDQGGNGLVFVSVNYRLGAFGWLAGPTFQKDGDANAGLLDQRLALQWVQKYITKFGGNPDNVTVIGESAGGGSIMHQITAAGGAFNGSTPFQKAIIQSPGYFLQADDAQTEQTLAGFLKLLNVTTIAQARTLPFNQLFAANAVQVGNSPYGQFTYGPAVDHSFVHDLPGKLLANGRFDHSPVVMVGHNGDEGIAFTNFFVQNDTGFRQAVGSALPPSAATPSNLDYISKTMYPAVFDGTHGYANQIARTDAALSELVFTCNTFYLDKAFNNQTYAYLFAVPPATHGEDVGYTYYSGASITTDPQAQVAINMQQYFLNFAKTGNANGHGVVSWDQYGSNSMLKVFNTTGNLRMIPDATANYRCNWYQANE